ncbi:MAG TPA: ATP-dependent Clp protease proteolytic subunit [Candidatus Binatia bacterium]|jgi:ClpP class serine protease|nr:ATP-dependent Clp protease proteolytic subunit [Candidatus Binatia bacterium]
MSRKAKSGGANEKGIMDMESVHRSWWSRLWNLGKPLFWLVLLAMLIQQSCGSRWTDMARGKVLARFQNERKSRVIAMIHRQETVSLLGVPISSYIDIEDSEEVLRAIRLTPDEQPIDLILHTPGGLVLAAEQIAKALVEHKGKVTVFVPHYAMSGGTLIALAADEIVMDSNAVLGPVDPQIGELPAASIMKVLEFKKPNQISDGLLILADMAAKSRLQVASFVAEVLLKRFPKEKAIELATILSDGRWTHDFPITVAGAHQLGLPVSTNMPRTVYDLMDLYPQAGTNRPSVLYVPLRRQPPDQGNTPQASRGAPGEDQSASVSSFMSRVFDFAK